MVASQIPCARYGALQAPWRANQVLGHVPLSSSGPCFVRQAFAVAGADVCEANVKWGRSGEDRVRDIEVEAASRL